MKYNFKQLLKSGIAIVDLPVKLTFNKDKSGNRRCIEEERIRKAAFDFCKRRGLKCSVEKLHKFEFSKKNKLIVKLKQDD
ncbi:MAG: hypothetical protein ACOWWH_12440 [Eubacteriaceae bacterium]